MAIFHCSIKIIGRSGGRSAVASAAYRSGEILHNDETGLVHDFTHKSGVVYKEIMLPSNAPKRYLDREVLWNEVQQNEKRTDAQFAREIEVALPKEMNREQQIECIHNYVSENFVSKGMIADIALHDKGDGNPHCHILLTVREIDEKQKWKAKQRSVFANTLDEKGRPIYNPETPSYNPKDKEATSKYRIPVLDEKGNQKIRVRQGKGTEKLWEKITIPLNDWNEHSKCEEWRSSWATNCNKFLSKENQIDHRSYCRQGLEYEPTIHEGVTAQKIEKEGKVSDRCEINREINERNKIRKMINKTISDLTKLIIQKAGEIYGRYTNVGRGFEVVKQSRKSGKDDGATAKGNRTVDDRERKPGGTIRRVNTFKQSAEQTNKFIEETNSRIDEIKRKIRDKGDEINERIRRVMEARRSGSSNGTTAIRDTESKYDDIRKGQDDIRKLIRELDAKERTSEEKQKNRETERKRFDTERQSKVEERTQTIDYKEPGHRR